MDVENLAKELILKNMTPEQQMAVLDSIKESVAKAKEVQKRKIGENVDLVVQALKKIEDDIRSRYDDIGNAIEKRVASIKDGRDGIDGKDGKDGKDGRNGKDGLKGDKGDKGEKGKDGVDGIDGVSVLDAKIDFDGSLVISLSNGKEINVGEVVSQDVAEKIKVISTMSSNGAVGISDEGVSVTSGVKNINFVGATVTASSSGDDVTVNVSAGTGTVTSVAATGGTGISVSGSPITTSGTLTITNTAPDQTVSLTGAGTTSISGTYPSFTITSNDQYQGTVTSITGGSYLTGGTITSSGTLSVDATSANTVSKVVARDASGNFSAGTITATGFSGPLNGTVGATTPNTGAFTTLSASGVATFSAGSAAAPAITTSGDTNNGIFFPAADVTAITTAGSERMRIDSSGNVGIGTTSLTGYNLRIVKNSTGATTTYGVTSEQTIQSDVTSSGNGFYTDISTQNASFTLSAIHHFRAAQGTFGASSTVTNQYCFFAPGGAIGATTNYGFYAGNSAAVGSGKTAYGFRSDINIATGGGTTYNFFANGTAENYFAGNVGIGAVAGSATGQLRIAGNGSGATTFNGISLETSIQSGVTSAWRGLLVRPTTQATAFTLNNLYGVYVNPQTFGAGSTVTNQYGFHAENTLTGATNNYGFYSNIASGTGRWNFYANGTADNYFAGNVGIGTTSPTAKLHTVVTDASSVLILERTGAGATSFTADFSGAVFNQSLSGGADYVWKEGGTEWMRLTNTGNVGIGTSSPYNNAAFTSLSIGGSKVGFIGLNNASGTMQATIDTYNNQFRIGTNGTSNPIVFNTGGSVTEAMRIDSSGNVGIGTTSPSTYGKFAVQTQTSNAPTVAITGSGLNPQLNHYINDSTAVLRNLNQIQFVTGSSDISNYQGYMTFSTMGSAGGTISERMRINSNGKILFNTTTQNINEQVGMVYSSNAGVGFSIKDSNAQNGNTFIEFRNGTTLAGNITSNGTTTMTYGSASDYRLKENLVPLTGALAKLGSLRPKVGNWKVDGSEFVGFVAHELQEVFPDAVVGEKDRVDADGNPLHQMVDTGSASIIATLTAALQEAHGLIKDLQTRVATLEAK